MPPEEPSKQEYLIEDSGTIEIRSVGDEAAKIYITVDLQAGARLRLTVDSLPTEEAHTDLPHQPAVLKLPRLAAWPFSLAATLFGIALLVYLVTRLIALPEWPIYFFTDEAVHTILAADLVRDGFKNYAGDFLPTFFENGGKYRLGFTVYVHLLPYLVFGKSVFVTRATSVLVTLAAAGAVGLMLRRHFKISYWWSGVLFLSITPTWFLHSRTAFEYAIAVTLYTLSLYFYLEYRLGEENAQPRHLYWALIFGALAFYSYSPMQMVVLVSGVLLALFNLRYHWQHRSTSLRGLGLLLLLALPYVRFMFDHPDANYQSMKSLGTYWIGPQPLGEKILRFFTQYLHGLDPAYWFFPNQHDLIRHQMKGYGHVSLLSLPLVITGLVIALRNWRSPAHRALVIAVLAAPVGAALVQLGVTRALVMVIPLALLTALGADWLLRRLESPRRTYTILSIGLGIVLALVNFAMLRDAVVNGPTWFQDYTLGGMQYGGKQLFEVVDEYSQEHPSAKMIISPSWGNGSDVIARFFASESQGYTLGTIDAYLYDHLSIDKDTIFVMTPEELDRTIESNKFQDLNVEEALSYPNGKPGFFFVHLRYVDNIDEVLEAERTQRRELKNATVFIDGQQVEIRCSPLDIGSPQNLFDGDPSTVIRTFEANPLVIEVYFMRPRMLDGLSLVIGSTELSITMQAYAASDAEPVTLTSKLEGSVENPLVHMDFGSPVPVQVLRMEINDLHQGEPGHVHIWEIGFEEQEP